ncbi:MAG: hypothetical protein ACRC50_02060 [Gaiella sp.]
MNELVRPLGRRLRRARRGARLSTRALVVEALGPLTMLGGLLWALAQPYRIAFFHPEGKGLYDWLAQGPLLAVLVGLVFALVVAPGLVEDLDAAERDGASG